VVGVLVSPTSLAFGQVAVGSSSASSTITLTSTGTAPLSVTAVALAGNQPKDFTLVDGGCTAGPIAPGQSCTVTVSFTPRSLCGASAQVFFADDAPGSPRAVTLSGTGVLGGAMVPFQSTLYCTSPGAEPQEFSANVDGKVWFDEYGSRLSPPAIATVTATSGVQEDRGAVTPGWTLWGLTIAPDGSRAYTESRPLVGLYLDVASPTAPFARYPLPGNAGPLGVGPDGAFWYAEEVSCGYAPLITRYLPGSPPVSYTASPFWLAAHVKGCAIPTLVTAGPDGNVWIGLTALKGGVIAPPSRSGFLRLTTDGTPLDFLWLNAVPYAATLGPDGNLYALTGTGVSTGCELRRFTAIGASSTVPLPGSVRPACRSMTTGPDGRIWMVGEVGDILSPVRSMIAVGTSGVVTTYPAPTGLYLAAGPDAGLWFDADDSTVGRFDLGGSPARAFVSPASIGFPSTSLAVRSELRDVRILSVGTGPLSLGALSLQGSEASNFVLVDTCSGVVLPPGASCVVRVASRPLRPGSHRATLVVPSDDTFSPRVVQLSEYTLPPPPIATPSLASFPTTAIGDHSPPATLTLTNPADLALHVDSVGIDGANAGDFAIDTDRCSATDVPAGGSCTVTVRFGPTASGHRTANVTFVDLGITPTQTLALAGEGAGAPPPGEPCQCSSTGGFVNPVVVDPVAAATSPHGLFHLEVSQSGARPSHFTITNASGAVVWDWTPPVDATWPVVSPWGFSPDDERFVLHYATLGSDWIELFDLTRADPRVHAWANSEIIDTWATATSPAGSMGFSPDGAVLLAVQLQRNQSDQRAVLNLVTASGSRVQGTEWNLPSMAPSDAGVGSAFWGFSPDGHSFTFMRMDATGSPQLTLLSLPSGTEVQHLSLGNSVARYVQFAPCGEVLGVVTQATDPQDPAPTNPVSISLYSTSPTARGAPPLRSVYDLPAGTIEMAAGPQSYTAEVEGYPNTVVLAPNTSAGGTCAPPEVSSPGGGSDVPPPVYGPTFTDKTPPLTAIAGSEYAYTFAADGEPTPVFALTVAPSWLTIDPDSGAVSGTPPLPSPAATYTFTYSVYATNAVSFDNAGPFTVTVHPPVGSTLAAATPPPTVSGALGPKAAPTPAASTLPAPNLLLLPHGRGQIELSADVTPAVSIFTYAETDRRAGPLGHLVFAGLGFTFTAVDATTGASVTVLADAPRVTLAFGDAELRAARIRDLSTLGLYWWSGSAWVNQLPCPGCGVDPTTRTLSARLAKVGEYALAAALPPPPTLTVTPETVYTAAGVPFAGVLATFPPPDPGDEAGRFAVTVRWGDERASGALLSRSDDGTVVISGVHTWNAPGTYPVVLTVWNGGASQDVGTTALVATTTGAPMFSAAAPPLTVTEGAPYAYAFAAVGVPAPTFALAAGAPSWLSMDATTGVLSGTPPRGTAQFTYSVLASNGVGPDAVAGPFVVTVVLTRGYYTVTPCRVFDSRHAGLGGPNPLPGGSTTPVPIAGHCGIPPEATAVALNVTVTAPTGPGHLTLFPDGTPRPLASVSNYASGQTRANNAAIPLGASGSLDIFVGQASGSAHVIVDVSGYFR